MIFYTAADGYVVALDAKSGKLRWETLAGTAPYHEMRVREFVDRLNAGFHLPNLSTHLVENFAEHMAIGNPGQMGQRTFAIGGFVSGWAARSATTPTGDHHELPH
jgi:hypothetical protein